MAVDLSVVIPCHNEEGNLRPLFDSLRPALASLGPSYEIIVTDDASRDASWKILTELAAGDPNVRTQRFTVNCGESAASWAGLRAAQGKFIVTMDADLQNDPNDLPKFLEALQHFDCVCGTRVATRHSPSRVARVRSTYGTKSLRAGRRSRAASQRVP